MQSKSSYMSCPVHTPSGLFVGLHSRYYQEPHRRHRPPSEVFLRCRAVSVGALDDECRDPDPECNKSYYGGGDR